MADRRLPHVDVAGWLLGDLEPDEYERTERHLATCAACRADVDDLRDTAEVVLASGPDPEPSPGLADRIVATIRAESDPTPIVPPEGLTAADLTRTDLVAPDPTRPHDPGPSEGRPPTDPVDRRPAVPGTDPASVPDRGPNPAADRGTPRDDDSPAPQAAHLPVPRRPAQRDDDTRPGTGGSGRATPRWVRPTLAAATVAAVALVAFVLGTTIGGGGGDLELEARLVAPAADTSADVTVRRLDSGRAVDVTSDTLPILPDGGIYELWFVGPGDTPERPNRISAGTFHPDADGTTDVVLHAAVVPTDYPTVVITAEPNNGDPAVNGPEVVRADG